MRIVLVALSDPLEDSRLRLMAASLADSGAQVTVMTPGEPGATRPAFHDGVKMVAVPVLDVLAGADDHAAVAARRGLDEPDHALAGLSTRFLRTRARKQLRDQNRRTKVAEFKLGLTPGTNLLARLITWTRIWGIQRAMRADALLWRLRSDRHRMLARSSSRPGRRLRGEWRREVPYLLDHELAFAPALDALEYDVIHAHGYEALSLAAHAVFLARERGHDARLVYDADCCPSEPHRYRAASPEARRLLEQEYIRDVALVTTSSRELGRRLTQEHDLATDPVVVRTTPRRRGQAERSATTVRQAARVDPKAPLLVYSGTCSPLDGVHVAVRALPLLPRCHLAIVTPAPTGAWARGLTHLAQLLDCPERLHLIDGSGIDDLPSFLRTADVGIFPLQVGGDAALRLDGKLFDYLQADLPVVASRLGALRTLVERTGVGATFASRDPEDFADTTLRTLADPARYEGDPSRESLRANYCWEKDERRLRECYRGVGLSGAVGQVPLEPAAT